MTRWLVVALALFTAMPASAGVFKCKKADGSFMYQEKPCAADTEAMGTISNGDGGVDIDSKDPRDAHAELFIEQAPNGHYFVNGSINEQQVNFLVDTGATYVALPARLARSSNLQCEKVGLLNTANGASLACGVRIGKLKFGKFVMHNVVAVVMPNLSAPLLGMNVLGRFKIEQRGGQMVLTRPD